MERVFSTLAATSTHDTAVSRTKIIFFCHDHLSGVADRGIIHCDSDQVASNSLFRRFFSCSHSGARGVLSPRRASSVIAKERGVIPILAENGSSLAFLTIIVAPMTRERRGGTTATAAVGAMRWNNPTEFRGELLEFYLRCEQPIKDGRGTNHD